MKLSVIREDALDESFHVVQSPVFVVTRHGRNRRFLSRSAAINNLVHFMVTGTFDKAGIPTHSETRQAWNESLGAMVHKRGELTEQYWNAHHRTYRRLQKLMARRREIAKWQKSYDAATSNIAQLLSQKPY
ncbi:hypothetical protein FHW04_003350 [Pantoea sp. AN62]|uniref:hypothetical protein n=1 Tax=unclassified Pantoea TaxID=2630326 RepID=UPI000B7F0837|nr:hypothetical protein [Pantoea sp. AV62]OXM25451.1 hypothetical protein CBI35_07905 [Pantoea sp. AV62]